MLTQVPFPRGCSSRTDDGRGVLSHPLLQAAGDGELDLLVCETFHAPASRNGGEKNCNKTLVTLVAEIIPDTFLLHSSGGLIQPAKKGWVPGGFAFNLCPAAQELLN